MARTCVLIPGDGIGPEVCDAVVRVLDAAGAAITWDRRLAGVAAVEAGDSAVLPVDTCEAIRRHRVALKGPCTTPIGDGFSSVNVALRKELELYAAVRPVRNLHGVTSRFEGVDLVIVRENTEGLYSGIENVITEGVVTSLKVATERACRRIARFALAYERSRGRERVTAFHKANIMKKSDGLFLACAREGFAGSGVAYDERIIDAGCMRLLQEPPSFRLILCGNPYGRRASHSFRGLIRG